MREATLTDHMQTTHSMRKYDCDKSRHIFNNKHTIRLHGNTHDNDVPFKCQYCEFITDQTNSLQEHLQSHHLKRPCWNKWNSKEDLVSHLRSNHGITGELNYEIKHMIEFHSRDCQLQCEYCGNRFNPLDTYVHHHETHGKETPSNALNVIPNLRGKQN